MKLLRQVALILLISFVGEILKTVIPLPIPASVYGLVLMLIALCSGILRTSQVREAAFFFIEIMPVMFIPAGVGLLESWPQLSPIGVPVAIITLVSTVVVMIISGKITQFVIHKEAQRKTASSQTKEA